GDRVAVPLPVADLLACGEVPQLDDPVGAGGDQQATVRAEGDHVHSGAVPTQDQRPRASRVPDGDGPVVTGRGQAVAVGAVGDIGDHVAVGECPQVAVTETPQVVPLEAADVRRARGPDVLAEQPQRPLEVALLPGLAGDVHVGQVKVALGQVALAVGLAAPLL